MNEAGFEPDDRDLVAQVRLGNLEAYGELHQRHAGRARALAYRMTRTEADADDLVSEAFVRVLQALRAGGGPREDFRPYLFTTLRRLAFDRTSRTRKEFPDEVIDLRQTAPAVEATVLQRLDQVQVAAAFATLPDRWQQVLWKTEIEGRRPADLAGELGMPANAVSALAYRAREGLRQAYLVEHLGAGIGPECRWAVAHLGAYVRGTLSSARAQRVGSHLDDCARCRARLLELDELNQDFGLWLWIGLASPVAFGPGASGTAPTSRVPAGGRQARRPQRSRASRPARPGQGRRAVGRRLRTPAARSAAGVGLGLAALGLATMMVMGGPHRPGARRHPGGLARQGVAGQLVRPDHSTPGRSSIRRPRPAGSSPPAPAARTNRTPGRGPGPGKQSVPVPSSHTPRVLAPSRGGAADGAPSGAQVPVRAQVEAVGALLPGRAGTLELSLDTDEGGLVPEIEVIVVVGAAGSTRPPPPGDDGWQCRALDAAQYSCRAPVAPAGSPTHRSHLLPVWVEARNVSPSSLAGTVALRGHSAQPWRLPIDTSGLRAGYGADLAGDVVTIGNSVLGNPVATRQLVGNDTTPTVFVHQGGPPEWANASEADLDLPDGAEVAWASLAWGGAPPEPDRHGGSDPDPDAGSHPVPTPAMQLEVGERQAVRVEASVVEQSPQRRLGWAEVTGLFAGLRGPVRVLGGDLAVRPGIGQSAGWSLTVVFRRPGAPLRRLVVLQGLLEIASRRPAHAAIGGCGPSARASELQVGVGLLDGDPDLDGDDLTVDGHSIGGQGLWRPNAFAGTVVHQGQPVADPITGSIDRMGFELLDTRLALPGSRSAHLTDPASIVATGGPDDYGLYLVTLARTATG